MKKSLIATALVFFAGAVFGRLFGVKPLLDGAAAAAGFAGLAPLPAPARKPARRVVSRSAARKSGHRRSPPVA